MNEKATPAGLVWSDGGGGVLRVLAPINVPPARSAAYVITSEDGAYLTAAQCREVAAHLTALADAHEHKGAPMTATDHTDHEEMRP